MASGPAERHAGCPAGTGPGGSTPNIMFCLPAQMIGYLLQMSYAQPWFCPRPPGRLRYGADPQRNLRKARTWRGRPLSSASSYGTDSLARLTPGGDDQALDLRP